VCIHGHFDSRRGYGVQQYYPYIHQFITVLRDPFEIAVSDYFYAKAQGESRFIGGKRMTIAENYRGIEDFFERAVMRRDSFLIHYMPRELTLDNFERLFDTEFVYMGIAEDVPESANRLADKLGFPRGKAPHINQSPRDEPIPPGLRDTFVRKYPVDYALYNYAAAHYKD
jgi:hypothetical protein